MIEVWFLKVVGCGGGWGEVNLFIIFKYFDKKKIYIFIVMYLDFLI